MGMSNRLLDRYRILTWGKFRPKGKLHVKWINGNFYIYPDKQTLKELIQYGKTNDR